MLDVPRTDVLLKTEWLILRAWRPEDLIPFADMNADPAVMEFFRSPLSREESDALATRIRARFDQHGFGLWAIEITKSNRFAGFVGFSVPTFQTHFTPCVEIGWRLAKQYWGRGYATEAAQAVLAFGFEELRFEEVVSFTAAANIRSIAVMRKIGMTHNPIDNFEHPSLPLDHPLRHHVLYRAAQRA